MVFASENDMSKEKFFRYAVVVNPFPFQCPLLRATCLRKGRIRYTTKSMPKIQITRGHEKHPHGYWMIRILKTKYVRSKLRIAGFFLQADKIFFNTYHALAIF